MLRTFLCLVVLIALGASVACAGGFFPMGVWYEGGVGAFRYDLIPEDPAQAAAMYKRDFADIAAHGVNAAVVPNTQPNHYKPLLDGAGASGVKLIIELDREGAELGKMVRGDLPLSDETIRASLDTKLKPIVTHPALWGVQLLDEPPMGTYDRYATVAKALEAYAPRLLPFCCLIGNGPVASFCEKTKPDVVAFDCYPIGAAARIGDPAPMLGYNGVANAACTSALPYRVPVWAVLQVHSITGIHRFPTPAEIRCMTYLALANGCKGVWWFLYQTEYWNKDRNEFMYGLVDRSFKGDARWEEIGKLTKEISRLAPALLELDLAPEVSVASDGIAHVLKDRQGRSYVFAVNTDTVSARKVTVRLDWLSTQNRDPKILRLPGRLLIQPDQLGGKLIWSDTLAPGDGALFEVK